MQTLPISVFYFTPNDAIDKFTHFNLSVFCSILDVLRSTPREDESWDDIYGDADRTRDEEERAERARLRRINEGTSMTDDFHFLSNTWRTLYKKECDQWPLRRRTLHYAIQVKIEKSASVLKISLKILWGLALNLS